MQCCGIIKKQLRGKPLKKILLTKQNNKSGYSELNCLHKKRGLTTLPQPLCISLRSVMAAHVK